MPDGAHWSDKKGQLGGDFTTCALPRVGDRFGAIAGHHDRLFVADIHNDSAPLRVLSDPDTLRGLYQGGHRGVAMEFFPVAHNQLFEGYYKGEVSNDAMRFFVDKLPSNFETDMQLDAAAAEQHKRLYGDLVENARAQKLQVRGLGGDEGSVSDENYERSLAVHKEVGNAMYDAAKIIDKTEGFMNLPPEQQKQILEKELYKSGVRPEVRELVTTLGGLGEDKTVTIASDMDTEEALGYYARRLNYDSVIAGRVDDFAAEVGGGVTTLYGGWHLWRAGESEGEYGVIGEDIDDSIGNDRSAVISVFPDSRDYWQNFKPDFDSLNQVLGVQQENAGDYQLDMKNGKWYDGKTDTDCKVEIPESLKPPTAAPLLAPKSVLDGIKW